MNSVFSPILEDNEKIIWSGRPNFIAYVLSSMSFIIFLVFWFSFIGIFTFFVNRFGTADQFKESNTYAVEIDGVRYHKDNGVYYIGDTMVSEAEFIRDIDDAHEIFQWITVPFWIIGGIFFLIPFSKIFSFAKTNYAMTDKRVLISSGFIGIDFKTVEYIKIKNINVTVGLIDKILSTGTVGIFSGEIATANNSMHTGRDAFVGIQKPYETFKLLNSKLDTK